MFKQCWNRRAPQQINGYNCGMYVCMFAEQLSRDDVLEVKPEEVAVYRQLMVWEIVTNQLYSPPSTSLDDSLILGIDNIEMQDFEPMVN